MRTLLGSLLVLLLPLAVATAAVKQEAGLQPPPAPPPGNVAPQKPPPPEGTPPERLDSGEHRRPLDPPLDSDRGPQPPARRGRPQSDRAGRPMPGLQPPWAPLMRILAERRPELADRLERMRRQDPELFERVLMEAFMPRLERALDEAEADIKRHRPRGPEQPGGPHDLRRPDQPRPEREFEHHTRELHERQEKLEMRSHELAEKLKRLRHEDAEPEARTALREELTGAVNEQFEVRTELRGLELQRIERELQRLHENVEKMRGDFERRQLERESIIEQRVRQLLGDDFGGW